MSTSGSTFSPRNTFGTDARTTKSLLAGLHAWIRLPNEANASHVSGLLRTLPPSVAGFWNSYVKAVGVARTAARSETGQLDLDKFTIDHDPAVPFFDRALTTFANMDAFESDSEFEHHFTSTQLARAHYGKRGASAAPEDGANDREDADGEEGPPRPAPRRSNSVVSIGKASAGRRHSQGGAAGAGGGPPPGGGGGDSDSDDEDVDAIRRNMQRANLNRVNNGVTSSSRRQHPPRDTRSRHSSSSPEPLLPSSDVAAEALAALQSGCIDSDDEDVPEEVLKTRALAVEYRGKHNKEMVKQAVAGVSSSFPREAAEAIILNKFVDFEQVYQHNPAYVATSAVSVEGDLYVNKPAPKTPITNAHAFLVVYDKVVKYTLRFYPHRRKEFKTYRAFFSGQVHARPDLFLTFRDFDVYYRSNLGNGAVGHLLSDAAKDSASFNAFIAPSPRKRQRSPVGDTIGSGGASSKRIAKDYPTGVCERYNKNKPHDKKECDEHKPPRRHVCDVCFQASHRRGDAACSGKGRGGGVGVGGGVFGAAVRAI